jgi:hypothetical protein
MARRNEAADLAGQLIRELESNRAAGGAYPTPLGQLTAGRDPALFTRAIHCKPFKSRAIVSLRDDPEGPVALADDAEMLAVSPQLLERLLDQVGTPDNPGCTPTQLTKRLDSRLKKPFAAALARQIAGGTLPETVGHVTRGRTVLLYLHRHGTPRSPEQRLARQIQEIVQAHRQGPDYPLTWPRLAELAGASPALLKKAVAIPGLRDQLLVAASRDPQQTLVALAEDRDQLTGDPRILLAAIARMRTDTRHAFTLKELEAKVPKILKAGFAESIRRRIDQDTLPPSVGWIQHGKGPLLFLVTDLHIRPDRQSETAPPGAEQVRKEMETSAPPLSEEGERERVGREASEIRPTPAIDFAAAFDEAFERLDRQAGQHNLVSLAALRDAVPVDRAVFDRELQQLRLAGRYGLSAADGRQRISPEDRLAAIQEEGSCLLFVSRKQP